MTALYICYQSLLDPLTQTQVVAYLEGISKAGYRVVLLTFEPRPLSMDESRRWRKRLATKNILWHWCRYHKQPKVPATTWDIMQGISIGLHLARKYDVSLLHARCHVPGLMALVIKRLIGGKLLLDIRGFMAEEYADAGIWPANGKLFRATKHVERILVHAADGIVVLTDQAKEMLHRWYPRQIKNKPVHVIPCCVDFRNIPEPRATQDQQSEHASEKTIVYVGKLDGWYLVDAMVAFIETALKMIPGLRWQVWTQSDPKRLQQLLAQKEIDRRVTIGFLPAEKLHAELAKAHAGLSFIKPCLSKFASSPTKIGEYLAAGLPVITTAGIGDVDQLLSSSKLEGRETIGVTVSEFTETAYQRAVQKLLRLWADLETPKRCRMAARKHRNLEQLGWEAYRLLYQKLVGKRKKCDGPSASSESRKLTSVDYSVKKYKAAITERRVLSPIS